MSMRRVRPPLVITILAGLSIAALLTTALPALANLTVSSSGFQDGVLASTDYGNNTNDSAGRPCGGQGISPALAWSGAPPNTQSYAITMYDPEGRGGLGVSHWVLYNIPASVTSLGRGEGAGPNAKYTPGKGQGDWIGYRGPCPGPGDAPHHYTIVVYALDLPPNLPPGLDRDGLFKAISGHTVGSGAGIVMKYSRR
jgi:Raf kinase inhibitor-like YbhB/YbcL family protein